LYASPNIISVIKLTIRWEGRVARRGYDYSLLVGKPEGKMQLERRRRSWEDNIKFHIKEMG